MKRIIALCLLIYVLTGCSAPHTVTESKVNSESRASSEIQNSMESIKLIKPNKTVKIQDSKTMNKIIAIIDEIKKQTPEKITQQSNGWVIRVVIKGKLKTEDYMFCTDSCVIDQDKYLLTDEQLKTIEHIFETNKS